MLKLNDTGGKIISIVNGVKYNYGEVQKINSHSPEIIHNYGVYCMFVSQNLGEGKRCLSQSKRAYFEKRSKGEQLGGDLFEGDEGNTAAMVVSGTRASMGKILHVNDFFIEMSGYPKEEIAEKSIDKVLPQVFQFYHEQTMLGWLDDESKMYMQDEGNRYFREVHKGFLKQKNGFIIPVYYRVKYNIFEEKFHVSFRNEKEFNENFEFKMYFITDHKGAVRDVSSLGYAYFGLTKDNLTSAHERYFDELGIYDDEGLYNEEGLIMRVPRKA